MEYVVFSCWCCTHHNRVGGCKIGFDDRYGATALACPKFKLKEEEKSDMGLFGIDELYGTEIRDIIKICTAGGFPHKPPKDGKMSKVFQKSMDMIRDIVDGSFWTKWNLDMEWIRYVCGIKPSDREKITVGVHTYDQACALVMRSVECLAKAKGDAGLFPRNKDSLPTTLPDFLCNERTNKSFFLYFLARGNETLQEARMADQVNKVPAAFLQAWNEVYAADVNRVLPYIADGVVRLTAWHKEHRKNTERWMPLYRQGDFWREYLTYLSEIIGEEKPSNGHFQPGGPTHVSMFKRFGLRVSI